MYHIRHRVLEYKELYYKLVHVLFFFQGQQNIFPLIVPSYIKFWNLLQKGLTVEEDGEVYEPDMVLGPEREGIRFVYATDTRPCESLKENSKGADLLIAEGMYGETDKQENAIDNKHMTMQEAAEIARDANAKELWFTHYSSSVVKPEDYKEEIEKIFTPVVFSHDGQHTTLRFRDEEEKND